MSLYRPIDPELTGWLEIVGPQARVVDMTGWRPATKLEIVWHYITVPKISLLGFTAIILVSAVINAYLP